MTSAPLTPTTGMRRTTLRGLPYQGGKSGAGPWRMAQWLVRHLPEAAPAQWYLEPFAGMASVLLNRQKVGFELLNDSDESLVNWWRTLRDRSDELSQMLTHTPRARAEYEEAQQVLSDMRDQPPDTDMHPDLTLRWAWAYTVVVEQSVQHHPHEGRRSWHYSPHRYAQEVWGARAELVAAVAARVSTVHLECGDANDVLCRFLSEPQAVVYCDPPYPGTRSPWRQPFDVAAFTSLLTDDAVAAQVAVSGYREPSSWASLDRAGWVRTDRKAGKGTREALWTNYQPQPPTNPLRLAPNQQTEADSTETQTAV